MKVEKNNIKYSAEDIRKYLDGQLTEQEMQALEKAALEDPFLSDAIEGIRESRNHKVSFESGVEELQKRLTERIREKNRTSAMVLLFSKWRIAASILFILGIAVLTLTYINRKTRKTEIAKSPGSDSGMVKTPSTTPAVNSDSDKSDMTLNQQVITEKKIRKKKLLPFNYDKAPDSSIVKPVERPADYSSKSSDTVALSIAAIPSNSKNKATDPITTESPKKRKEYKSEGFASMTPASTALNEVTIVGYGTAKKKDISSSTTKPDTQNFADVSGWVAFRNYIDSNKKILTADSILRGDEVISFVVNNKSKLSSFKIEKSISLAHDAEIIRLVKEAPPLKITRGKKKRLHISISFN